MRRKVFWENPGYRTRPALKKNIECNFLIIGGGIAGICLAYFLNKNGARNIVLVERDAIGSGATGKSAGILTVKGELDIRAIFKNHGEDKGMMFWRGNKEVMQIISDVIRQEKIKCDFEIQQTLFCGYKRHNYNDLCEEYLLEKELDPKTEFLREKELKEKINSPLFTHAIFCPEGGISVNPLKHVQSLSNVVEKKGVKIYENTPVIHVKKNIAITPRGEIAFKKIIWAVDAEHSSSKVKKLKSTILVTEKLTKKQMQKLSFLEKKIMYDSKENYDCLKVTKDNRLLLGFGGIILQGGNKKTVLDLSHMKHMKRFLRRLFPQLQAKVQYAWSGSYGVTRKWTPIVQEKGNMISIAGSSSQVVCFMTSKYIADKLTNKKSYLDQFFDKVSIK